MNFNDFNLDKCADRLLPVIIQDNVTLKVLMLGYMNREAFDKTVSTGKVTFYSRTRQTLWTKGETSGHFLLLNDMYSDCDNDTLLIKATPIGRHATVVPNRVSTCPPRKDSLGNSQQ